MRLPTAFVFTGPLQASLQRHVVEDVVAYAEKLAFSKLKSAKISKTDLGSVFGHVVADLFWKLMQIISLTAS